MSTRKVRLVVPTRDVRRLTKLDRDKLLFLSVEREDLNEGDRRTASAISRSLAFNRPDSPEHDDVIDTEASRRRFVWVERAVAKSSLRTLRELPVVDVGAGGSEPSRHNQRKDNANN